jgi:hypothetical protein
MVKEDKKETPRTRARIPDHVTPQRPYLAQRLARNSLMRKRVQIQSIILQKPSR